jgi:hypothetical protein
MSDGKGMGELPGELGSDMLLVKTGVGLMQPELLSPPSLADTPKMFLNRKLSTKLRKGRALSFCSRL